MATIDPNQQYDAIHTLTFSDGSGSCNIRLYRGSFSSDSGTVYYRTGTSGSWTTLNVSGANTTFPVSDTTMQIAHDWNKSGDDYMTPSFYGGATNTNLTEIAISQKAVLSGDVGNYFMQYYAYSCDSLTTLGVPDTSQVTSVGNDFMSFYAEPCTSLTTLGVPDTSQLTSVGSDFMRSYANGCTSLTTLDVPDTSQVTSVGDSFMYAYANSCDSLTTLKLPAVGWFANNNVDWLVPSGRLGNLDGVVQDPNDVSDWEALTVSGETLHTNYIRDNANVYSPVLPTERGFVYSTSPHANPGNISPASSSYESVINETGDFNTGTFSLTETGLTAETTYYVRAYDVNDGIYSYGDEVMVTTDPSFNPGVNRRRLLHRR